MGLRNELSALRQENRQASERLAAAEVARYQGPTDGEQQRELLRLRGEVSSLQKQVSQFSNTGKELGKQRRQNARESDAPLVARETWKNVGLATPIEAFQTLSWARENRETNVIANSLSWADEQARSKIDAIFAAAPEAVRAKYGSADAYRLSLFDHPVPDDSRRVVGYRILTESIAEDTASLLVEQEFGDGRKSTGLMHYVRIGDEWRQALDFDGPDTSKMSAGLQAEAGSNPEDTESK